MVTDFILPLTVHAVGAFLFGDAPSAFFFTLGSKNRDPYMVARVAAHTDGNGKGAGLDDERTVGVVVGKLLKADIKRNGLLFALGKRDLLKGAQLANGTNHRRNVVVDIALYCLLAVNVTRILNRDADVEALPCLQLVKREGVGVELCLAVGNGVIGKPEAEGVKGRGQHILIVAPAVAVIAVHVSAGGTHIIVKRDLMRGARDGNGKTARGVNVAV